MKMTELGRKTLPQCIVQCTLFVSEGIYREADKSLARPGRKQAAPVKSVMGRGID